MKIGNSYAITVLKRSQNLSLSRSIALGFSVAESTSLFVCSFNIDRTVRVCACMKYQISEGTISHLGSEAVFCVL